MRQKIIWMHFLIVGISLPLLLAACGKEDIEYRMKVALVYHNNTDSLVKFELRENISLGNSLIIELSGNTQSKIFSYEYQGVDKVIKPKTCCKDFLNNVYSSRDWNSSLKEIVLNGSYCVIHINDKFTNILNYNSEIIGDTHFRYTYTFKKDDFENAVLCLQ